MIGKRDIGNYTAIDNQTRMFSRAKDPNTTVYGNGCQLKVQYGARSFVYDTRGFFTSLENKS